MKDETVTQHLGGSTSLQEGPNAPAGDWDEMARELLPCPFCGGAAQFMDTSEVTNEGGIVVECQKCRACTAVVFSAKDDPKPYALYLWNSRDATALRKAVADKTRKLDLELLEEKAVSENRRLLIEELIARCEQINGEALHLKIAARIRGEE